MAQRSIHGILACALLLGCATSAMAQTVPPQIDSLEITPGRVRARPGDRLTFRIRGADASSRAVLLAPGGGTRPLVLDARKGEHGLDISLPADGAAGLYLIHVWTGEPQRPKALGKAAIVVGPIVLDFFLPSYLDPSNPRADLSAYLDDFRSLGGNTLIAHALITPDRAYFPSAIARNSVERGSPSDIVEQLLNEADRRGLSVFLSVSWDMTHPAPYTDRMRQITALMAELFSLYAGHVSLAGFYSYQEGSGTYYVPYVREFTGRVKALNPGLLSACAPFVDDPLVAGYLSTVDTLDMMIFQGQVMASYRTDNRKKYPLRRVRDFAALGIGAKWLQDKIAIAHVELFGYLENRPDPAILAASYENIFGQIASVATAPGADGIALFAYHPHIWSARRDARVQRSRQAVADGLDVFRRLQRTFEPQTNPLTVYSPYSDWIIERWTTSTLPGLDAFRRAGVPVDILPYAPAIEESVYPYFPFHMNPSVLERLLSTRRVLLLPDVSGFQQTDSDLIDAFVKRGGVVVAFGPQLPMGRSFERDELFGGREAGGSPPRGVRGTSGSGRRTQPDGMCTLPAPVGPGWSATTGRVLAKFDDGSPAILANAYGAGLAVAVLPSAPSMASGCPDLLRDVLDHALKHAGHPPLTDVIGLTEASDVAIAPISSGLTVTIVNHDSSSRDVSIRPALPGGGWFEAVGNRSIDTTPDGQLRLAVPAGGVRSVELRRENRQHP